RDQHPAHLGTEPASASPHSLRHSCRWTLARSSALDPPTLSFLLTGEGPQPRLSWQVPRRSETSAQPQQAMLQRSRRRSRRSAAVRKTHAPPAPPRLGRLCQASLRWSHAGVALSRPLHPSRGHLQSSLVGLRARARHLPLEGLCSWGQARQDDPWRYRVLAAFLSARAPQRFRPHPSLRVPRQSLSRFPLGTIPTTAVQLPNACPGGDWPSFLRDFVPLALPALRRSHDRGAEIYGCGIIHMLLLRFFVAGPPLPSQGRARSRRRTRVSASSPTLLTQSSTSAFVHFGCPYNHPVGIPTTPRSSPQALFRSRLPFKSHSAPRPPQTPAASS